MIFVVLGHYTPLIYYQHIDTTEYYQVRLPIKVEPKMYKPCDLVTIYIERRALADLSAEANIELRLVKEGGTGREIIDRQTKKLSIQKSLDGNFQTITSHWELPCTIKDGIYLFEGIANYHIHGIQKHTALRTQEFIVDREKGGEK